MYTHLKIAHTYRVAESESVSESESESVSESESESVILAGVRVGVTKKLPSPTPANISVLTIYNIASLLRSPFSRGHAVLLLRSPFAVRRSPFRKLTYVFRAYQRTVM